MYYCLCFLVYGLVGDTAGRFYSRKGLSLSLFANSSTIWFSEVQSAMMSRLLALQNQMIQVSSEQICSPLLQRVFYLCSPPSEILASDYYCHYFCLEYCGIAAPTHRQFVSKWDQFIQQQSFYDV